MCAVYVDNVCMIGTSPADCRRKARAAQEALEEVGLKCHDIEQDPKQTVFTGLCFDHSSKRVRIKQPRAWQLIKALQYASKLPSLQPQCLERLLGHYTWTA